MAETSEKDITSKLSMRRIIVPVLLGLFASGYLLVRNLNEPNYVQVAEGQRGAYAWVDQNGNGVVDADEPTDFELNPDGRYELMTAREMIGAYQWTTQAILAILGALLMVGIRDLFYMIRIRILTGNKLSFRQSFDVIMIWEFASALTPSVVGGSGIAIFILNREGINLGKSTATVFVTALMDEAFYIIMVPLIILLVGMGQLFPETSIFSAFGTESIHLLFYIGYGFILFLTMSIIASILWFPHKTKRFLIRLFSFRLLRRWRKRVVKLGNEIIVSSVELKGQPISYWAKAMGATFVSWTARFFTLNFIFLAFVGGFDHLQVYGRQLVMWVIMLISPTPGSSGVAELALSAFFSYLLPVGMLALVALIWRLLTYFPYLFVGTIVLPGWLRRTSKRVAKAR
jgi:uncharacterized protein (TIRG00374 family)